MKEMRVSFVALDRQVEEKMRTDPESRQRRPTLSTARTLSDQELLKKLAPVLGDLDRETFRQMCTSHVSAEEMVKGHGVDGPRRFDSDWPWLAATVLWERWAPDIPSFEIIDNAMQAGYHAPDTVKRCEIWLDVWSQILALADRRRITKLSQLDELFAGSLQLGTGRGVGVGQRARCHPAVPE